MKAGLFINDHVKPEFQKVFGDYPEMFARLFPGFEFEHYDVCNGQFPENLDSCDVYMATGSSHSVYEDLDWIHQLKELVRDLYKGEKYFVGFCFGHQLMGEALGGKVEEAAEGWCVGVHEFEIIKQREWMLEFQNPINLLMMCQDQIVDLPKDGVRLAGNGACYNGIIQVGERFLGIQAHPEFSVAYNQILMETRRERIGKERILEGIASLSKDVQNILLRDWILRFLAKK